MPPESAFSAPHRRTGYHCSLVVPIIRIPSTLIPFATRGLTRPFLARLFKEGERIKEKPVLSLDSTGKGLKIILCKIQGFFIWERLIPDKALNEIATLLLQKG